jgi:hypothetical protein
MKNSVKLSPANPRTLPHTLLRTLPLTELRSWLLVGLFVAGNIVVPQLAHLIPGGGQILVPIYILTIFASMRYGLGVGLLTAVLSPVVNHLLFGMPPVGMLPSILAKGIVLAFVSAWSVKLLMRRQ